MDADDITEHIRLSHDYVSAHTSRKVYTFHLALTDAESHSHRVHRVILVGKVLFPPQALNIVVSVPRRQHETLWCQLLCNNIYFNFCGQKTFYDIIYDRLREKGRNYPRLDVTLEYHVPINHAVNHCTGKPDLDASEWSTDQSNMMSNNSTDGTALSTGLSSVTCPSESIVDSCNSSNNSDTDTTNSFMNNREFVHERTQLFTVPCSSDDNRNGTYSDSDNDSMVESLSDHEHEDDNMSSDND